MSVFDNIKTKMLVKRYSKKGFVTIDPEKFLRVMYNEIYNESGKQVFVISNYAADLLAIANEMNKYSAFDRVEVEDGKCYVDNDLVFFALNNKFWEVYNQAMDYYDIESSLAMSGWYNPDITREEREACHNIMVELLCERTAVQNALDESQEEKRLLTFDERGLIVNEYNAINECNMRSL
ncbi:MAG: hypothetical protein IKC79_03290 [Clostridia bacterium]|nr:hypothetical protein [Clostridia bacterium]